MRTLQISLEHSEYENSELNFQVWRRIFLGAELETYVLYGLSPFSTLILTLYQNPSKRRAYGATVLKWYGYEIGLLSPEESQREVFDLFNRYVTPHIEDPQVYVTRAIGIWNTLLEDLEVSFDLDEVKPPTIMRETLPDKIPHVLPWLVIKGSDRSFIWRRSSFVENPLLMDLLREVQDRYGVLPIWSKHDEGEYILIPLN